MPNELSSKFTHYLDNEIFVEVLRLVRENSEGKVWLMGGFLYKNLARELYGYPTEVYTADLDFVLEKKADKLKEIPGWEIYTNSYGSQNYQNEKVRTSFTDIRKAIRMTPMKEPTIEQFITHTPLTIQSIAYDINESKLFGDIGIQALLEKRVEINDHKQAEYYSERKGKTVEIVLEEKRRELNF